MCTRIVIGNDLAKIKPERAACLPYILKNGQLHFLFAIDKNSGDVTDMGGGVKKDEFALSAGVRELKEESGEVFRSFNARINEMGSFVGALGQNGKMSTLFIPVGDEWYKKIGNVEKPSPETEEMIWIDELELKGLLCMSDRRMWIRVKKFYQPVMTEQFKNILKVVYNTKRM